MIPVVDTSLASWTKSWQELGAAPPDPALHDRLIASWSEPHRHYHTLQHLGECLLRLESSRALAQRPAEIALGLWFHDAIYQPQRADNEERSAQWARTSVLDAALAGEVADRIHALVMATRHEATPEDADAQLTADIDLAILGAGAARFDEYERQVRAEYAHVPDEQFRAGRRRVLEGFMARRQIYCTEHFRAALESQARKNLRRAIARLA